MSDVISERMKQYFSNLVIDILSQKHQADDLQWSEPLELVPLDIEVKQVSPLLLLFRIRPDLLDSAIDQVFGVPVNRTKVPTGHHLVIARDSSISLLLVLQELFPEQLEQV